MGVKRLCCFPGCPYERMTGKSFCEHHKAEQDKLDAKIQKRKEEYFNNRPKVECEFYQTSMWRQERKKFLEENPYCSMCHEPATEVHHDCPDKSYLTDEYQFYDKSHWVSLCHDCHTHISNARAHRKNTSLNYSGDIGR